MERPPVRVLIVEDHKIFADALRLLLAPNQTIEVVGVAEDGLTAVDLALETDAQVVLMDLTLPRIDGLEVTRQLQTIMPDARVIVLTSQTADESQQAAFDAGAWAFITKSDAYEQIPDAIARAASK